jgi:hypothetical protein
MAIIDEQRSSSEIELEKGRFHKMDIVIKFCKPSVPQAPSNTSQNSGYQGV